MRRAFYSLIGSWASSSPAPATASWDAHLRLAAALLGGWWWSGGDPPSRAHMWQKLPGSGFQETASRSCTTVSLFVTLENLLPWVSLSLPVY